MPVEIRLANSAVADLNELWAWYDREGVLQVGRRLIRRVVERIERISLRWFSVPVKNRLIRRILEQVERLAEHPDLGRSVPEFGQAALRELTDPPFRIVYRQDQDAVRIIRVWRSQRVLRLPEDEDGTD